MPTILDKIEPRFVTMEKTLSNLDARIDSVEDEQQICRVKEEERGKKIDAMYKTLVTGNGEPPLPEIVRSNQKWIMEQSEERNKITDANRGLRYALIGTIASQIIILVINVIRGIP